MQGSLIPYSYQPPQAQIAESSITRRNQEDRDNKGCQVISAYSTNSQLYASLPSLIASYSNTIQVDDRIKYQIQYFDFPAEQYNVYAGETIYVMVEAVYSDKELPFEITQQDLLIPLLRSQTLGLPLQFTKSQHMTCGDFAHWVNEQLRLTGVYTDYLVHNQNGQLIQLGQSYYAIANLRQFLQHNSSFTFDSTTQRYAFLIEPSTVSSDAYSVEGYDNAAEVNGAWVYNFSIHMSPSPSLNEQRQRQLARLLGCNTTIKYTLDEEKDLSASWNFNRSQSMPVYRASYEPINYLNTAYLWQSPYLMILNKAFNSAALTDLGININLFFSSSLNTFAVYSGELPASTLCDTVVVRTTTDTQTWDTADKSKSDILAHLPWRAVGNLVSFGSQYIQTTDYSAGETLNAIRNMKFSITDDYGDPLILTKPYMLKIAVLYS